MTDPEKREKVIKGLEEAVDFSAVEQSMTILEQGVVRGALELLKAQEAAKPNIEGNVENDGRGSWWWYICGACRQPIDKGDKFCRWCGKRVKWDG